MSNTEACDQLRRRAMAYIGEHYDPERHPDASLLWERGIDHALGKRPKSLDEERRTDLSSIGTGLANLLAVSSTDDDGYSQERMAWTAFNMTAEKWGLELKKGAPDPPLSDLEQCQFTYDWAEIWLVNVSDGAWDATGAFLEDDEEAGC